MVAGCESDSLPLPLGTPKSRELHECDSSRRAVPEICGAGSRRC